VLKVSPVLLFSNSFSNNNACFLLLFRVFFFRKSLTLIQEVHCFCLVVLGMKSIKLLVIAKIETDLFVVGELLLY